MRLITSHELANRKKKELSALFCSVSKKLAMTKAGTPARRNALATLENINRAQAARLNGPG